LHEFACPHCGEAFIRPRLLDALERLRAIRSKPIVIVSGYRCPVHNHAVGGAHNSQHVFGAASDIRSTVPSTVHEAEAAGFVGIGTKRGVVVHVDVRDGGPARWTYDTPAGH
jgi:uncharacterized protein YcbK (DUF882 family)